MNLLEKYEKNHLKELSSGKSYPKFNPGDTLKVHLKVKEGEKERIQIFEGICIAKKNAGLNSSFTIRKISYGEGVERVLPLYSPQISKIELVKSGDVKRSKLYYIRNRSGKSARITEKNAFNQNLVDDQIDKTNDISSKTEKELDAKEINDKKNDINNKKEISDQKEKLVEKEKANFDKEK
jgi:large subunit ribosomal protein L19